MLSTRDLKALAHVRTTLTRALRYSEAQDTTDALRHGGDSERSPFTRALAASLDLLDTVTTNHEADRPSTGALLASVTATDADPAHVRQDMSDQDANLMLRDSLLSTGTTHEEAHRIADLYVPVTDDPSPDALAEHMAYRERVALIESGAKPSETWDETVGRMRENVLTQHPVTPRDVAHRIGHHHP